MSSSATSAESRLLSAKNQSLQPSFFASLFDFSFSRFVTIRFVKFVYVASIILMVFPVLLLIFPIITGTFKGVEVVATIVGVPIFAFFYLLGVRVLLELVVVVFRIGETATEVRDLLKASASLSSSS